MTSPEANEVREIVREWYAASGGGRMGDGPFSTFITVWIAFNALYAMRFDEVEGDWKQIYAFSKWGRVVQEHKRFLMISDYHEAVRTLAEHGVYDFRRMCTINIDNFHDLGQILKAVYQVRCNLFHGRKSAGKMRDQNLVEASCHITYRFVGALAEDDDFWESV
jgi:NAD-dependent SIR2 family protein deacetylase